MIINLIAEFAAKSKIKLLTFEGLAPKKEITSQDQKNKFARQMGFGSLVANDWSDLFKALSKEMQRGRAIILMDEISWMAHENPTFLLKLKNT